MSARESVAWVLVMILGVLAMPAASPAQDLELVNRTLTMAERCTAVTETALRALLPRYDTTTLTETTPGP